MFGFVSPRSFVHSLASDYCGAECAPCDDMIPLVYAIQDIHLEGDVGVIRGRPKGKLNKSNI